MATGKSGVFYTSSMYYTAKIAWAETYSPTANTSTISVDVNVRTTGYLLDYYPHGNIRVNGTRIVTFLSAVPTDMVYFKSTGTYHSFTTTGGSKRGPWTSEAIAHNSDGSKEVDIVVDFYLYRPDGESSNGSGAHFSTTQTISLTTIDRAAPSVSFTTSNVTTNGFAISATSSAKCNRWDYSTDNGSTWKNFSTTSGTSASATVTGLSVNTSYKVKVRARRSYNNVYGTASAKTVKTLGFAAVSSCDAFYVDAATAQVKPKVTVYETGFTYYATFKNGSTELFTTSALTMTAGTSTRTLTLSTTQKNKILEAMPNDKEKSFTLVFETYNGSTLIGTSSCTVKAKTSSANSAPTFPGFTFLDSSIHANLTGNDQVMIQGYSTLKVTAQTATAKNKAKIASYSATIADKSVKSSGTEISVGTVASSGTLELTVTAIDSRGWSTSVTKKVKVLKYEKPKIDSITFRRANGIDKTIQLSISGSVTSLKPNGSTEVNSVQDVAFRYKSTSASSYGADTLTNMISKVELSASKTSFSYSTNELLSLDDTKSYDFRFYVEDGVTSKYFYYVIPRGIPALALRKDKLGINNPDPKYTLDVTGDINLTGDIYINGVKLAKVLGLE